MGKIELEFFEDRFLKKNTIQYKLSILIGVDSLCYSIATSSRQLLGLRKYTYQQTPSSFRDLAAPVRQIADADGLLRKPFHQVQIGLSHPYISLIPKRLYNEEEKQAYLEKMVELDPADRFQTDTLPFAGAMGIYPVDGHLATELENLFPGANLCHGASSLANALAPLLLEETEHRLFINLRDGHIQVFAFEGKDLLLFNTYFFLESADIAYFLLLVCRQLSWDPDQMTLLATGLWVEDSVVFRTLQRFFPLIRFVDALFGYQPGPRLEQGIRRHWFADLLSL